MFQTFHDSQGRKVSLTSSHLIYVKEKGFVKATNVVVGDSLQIFSLKLNRLTDFFVSRVSFELKTGFIAPLTNQGTLLVNGVHASCYAEINSHYLADVAMTPLKLWYMIAELFGNGQSNKQLHNIDIVSYADLLQHISRLFLPKSVFD